MNTVPGTPPETSPGANPFGTLKTWFLASRPKTLWAAISPVIIGTAMAYSDNAMHLTSALAALFGAIMIQIATNFANDYYDYVLKADNSNRKGPLRVTQAGLVKPCTMRRAFIITYGIAALAGIYLISRGGRPVVIIGLASIIAGILYTGGPLPYGYVGLGEVFVLLFFGLAAVGGTYYVQTLAINKVILIAGLGPGLLSVAVLTVNNLRDLDSDKKAKKKTLAVRFGAAFARMEYVISVVAGCTIPLALFLITGRHRLCLLTLLIVLPAIPCIKTVFISNSGEELNRVLAITGKFLFLFSILFSLGWIL
ncbi:MAG: 1,4-dihydroxy-2-naphthoate polyprenyltransferase [bacterium]